MFLNSTRMQIWRTLGPTVGYAQEFLCKFKFGFYSTRSSETVVGAPNDALIMLLKELQPGTANLPASGAGSQVTFRLTLPSSQAELFSIESLVQATDQQSELIARPSADGAASKEVSAAAAVARVSFPSRKHNEAYER